MKKFSFLIVLLNIVCFSLQSNAQATEGDSKTAVDETNKVEVYYFHNTRRCATCNAIEDVTIEALKEYYPDKMKSGEVSFRSLNLEEEYGKKLAKELNISGQTLLVVVNGKEHDLTNDAFMYAKSKPEKFKGKLHKAIGAI